MKTSILVSWLCLPFLAGSVELPMTNPPAPFSPAKQEVQPQVPITPEFNPTAKTFTWGGRKLRVFDSGLMILTEDEQELARFYVYANTPNSPWITNQDTSLKAPARPGKHLGIEAITADTTAKAITVNGKIPCHPKGKPELYGAYSQTVTMEKDGAFTVNLDYEMPKEQPKSFMNMFWCFPHAQSYQAGNASFPFRKQERHNWAPKQLTVTLRNGEAILVDTLSKLSAYAYQGKNNRGSFRVHSLLKTPGKGRIRFRMKPTGTSPADTNAAGGVNFMKLDDLDLANSPVRNLAHNPYFAQGRTFAVSNCLIYPWKSHALATLSQVNPKFGRNCLRIDYDKKTNSTSTVIMHSTLSVSPGTYTVSFYARSTAPRGFCKLTLRNHAFRSYADRRFPLTDQWQRYQLTAKVPAASALTSLFGFRPPPNGAIFLDGIQIERGATATPFTAAPVSAMLHTSANDDFIQLGQPIGTSLTFTAWDRPVQGTAQVSVQDIFHTVLHTETIPLNLKPHEEKNLPLNLEGKIPQGVHTVRITYDLAGLSYRDFFRFSVMPFFANRHKLKNLFSQFYNGGTLYHDAYPGLEEYIRRSMLIGSGCSVHQPFPTPELQKLYDRYNHEVLDSSLGARTGSIKTMKKYFPYTKPQPGHTYMFLYFSPSRLDLWAGKGMILPDYRLLGGWNETVRKKFVDAAATIVAKSAPRRIYTLGSEFPPEIKEDPHYPDLIMAVREGVKKVYPNSLFIEGGSYNMDIGGGVREIDQFITKVKGKMPIEGIQTHTYTRDILSLEPNFKALVDMVENKHGLKNMVYYFGEGMHYGPHEVPAWNLESANWDSKGWITGPLSYDIGWVEKRSAAYCMRSWLIFMTKCNQVISACSSVCNRPSTFHLDLDLRPRVYQKIPNTLSMLLGNVKRFVADLSFAPDTKCLLWEDHMGRPVAAVWNQHPDVDSGHRQGPWATADFKTPVEFFDMMGAKRTATQDNRFPVSPFPFFIRGEKDHIQQLKTALAHARIIGKMTIPFRVIPQLHDTSSIHLTMVNTVARNVNGTIEANGQKTQVNMEPFAKTTVNTTLLAPIPYDRVDAVAVPYVFQAGDQTAANTFQFRAFAAKHFNGSWKDIPSIPIANKTRANDFTPDDCSASFQIAWDKDALYLKVTVRDSQFTHQAYPNEAERWNNDSLQLFIDTRCSALKNHTNTFDDDDYAYAIFPEPDGKTARMHRWRSPDIQLTLGTAAPKDMMFADDIPCTFTRTKDGYIYETAIPARNLMPARLEKHYSMAIAVYVNDRDHDKNVKQSLTITPQGTAPFNHPLFYPIMILMD